MTTRVVITGMGWVTPLGEDQDAVWSRLLAGHSAVGPVTRFDAESFPTNFAAEVKGFDLSTSIPNARERARHDKAGLHTRFAIAAASRAWAQAGLASVGVDPRRVGLYMGCGEGPPDLEPFARANIASWNAVERRVDYHAWARHAASMSAVAEVGQEPHVPLAHLAALIGCRGPAFNCMTACAAGTQAVGEAFEIIRRGDADVMLAGGSHSMIHPLGMTGFIRLTAMSRRRDAWQTASRPFDQTRDGFVMGEGAGVIVLESLEHALRRGAKILAEVAGYGSTADAFRITDIQPDGRGGASAMALALEQAGIDPRRPDDRGRPPIQYISAHGTGTPENDGIETAAVKLVFGDLAPRIPFSSVKSMMGHLIQAAGAVELMTCVLAIQTGWVPPTINLKTPDPRCDLDYVPNAARDTRETGGVDACISNGFGFGGQNDCVCVRRFVA